MEDKVIIRDAKDVVEGDWRELSAEVDGDRVWFKVSSDIDLSFRAEPFVAAGLLEAMIRGVPLEVEKGIPLSPVLHQQLAEIQEIYSCWNTDLSVIKIDAELVEAESISGSVGSFYSAGVDSSHTLMRHRDEINDLILILGFDGGTSDHDWDKRIFEHQEFANKIGKKLVVIKTNARDFASQRKIDWSFGHGLCLAAFASILKYQKLLIPSSHTYNELFPWGSHPLSDPMWSTGANQVIHDGAGCRRGKKMRDLCRDQEILDSLQVCWRSTLRNCGTCPKCVRTMIALNLLGGRCKKLPKLTGETPLKPMMARDEAGVTHLIDAILLAKEQGDHQMYGQLKRYHKRYQLSQLIPLVDRTLLNGFLRKLYRHFGKQEWLNERVSLRAKDHWSI